MELRAWELSGYSVSSNVLLQDSVVCLEKFLMPLFSMAIELLLGDLRPGPAAQPQLRQRRHFAAQHGGEAVTHGPGRRRRQLRCGPGMLSRLVLQNGPSWPR
jgi:hypothetical protein